MFCYSQAHWVGFKFWLHEFYFWRRPTICSRYGFISSLHNILKTTVKLCHVWFKCRTNIIFLFCESRERTLFTLVSSLHLLYFTIATYPPIFLTRVMSRLSTPHCYCYRLSLCNVFFGSIIDIDPHFHCNVLCNLFFCTKFHVSCSTCHSILSFSQKAFVTFYSLWNGTLLQL